ncbi:MAG: AAA family ATPase [Acidimicrobiia bacterium]|nr:AAA family ATPase [Acidimicrobiia bacterium]NNL71079.1 AAA family ATPase [Acidimicrobiia bacterium]
MDDEHAPLIEDLTRRRGVVLLLGASDTGKTTFARQLMAAAIAAGKRVAFVDADISESTVGPPTCVGLKWVNDPADLDDLATADQLQFVGSIKVNGLVLQQVVATAALVDQARSEVDLVVVDTCDTISGVAGQTLKYHKTELTRPEVIVALQRGEELAPIVGMLRRFFGADVEEAVVSSKIVSATPHERTADRAKHFAAELAPPLQPWRVRSTVFAPTLPAGMDPARLDSMLVGLQDGSGATLGLGVLREEDGILRVLTNHGEGMRGLRLGSMRIELDTFDVTPVRLRDVMFGL